MFAIIRNVGFIILAVYVWYVLCKDMLEDDEETEKDQEDSEIFIPTENWKIVKKGQKIPPGLHVRMNLETGVTEAKLLDKTGEKESQAVTKVKTNDEDFVQKSKLFKPSELREAMKNIKGDDIMNPDDLKHLTKKFRKYEELKEDLEELNLIPKTDVEILTEIIKDLKSSTEHKKEHAITLLEELEFLVHQIDNAVEFARQNGFTDIIHKNLNSSDREIKSESLKLFSSLVQNNPKVKVEAVETGSISLLLKLLSLDSDDTVKFRAITALSCLLRRFPYAQSKFVENGGLTVAMKLFESNNMKMQIKIATLMTDLLNESRDVEENDDFHIKQQYESVNLENLLLEQKWCDNLKNLLNTLLLTDSAGHDSIEKCLLAVKAIIYRCNSVFEEEIFQKLEERYKVLAALDENKDEDVSNMSYFTDLSEICTDILRHIPKRTDVKTEL